MTKAHVEPTLTTFVEGILYREGKAQRQPGQGEAQHREG